MKALALIGVAWVVVSPVIAVVAGRRLARQAPQPQKTGAPV